MQAPLMQPATTREFFAGVDLGQMRDWTAICLLQLEEYCTDWNQVTWQWNRAKRWKLIYLDRPALGTPYTEIVRIVQRLIHQPILKPGCDLVVDFTGVGVPVRDMLREMIRDTRSEATLVPIWIVGGQKTTNHGEHWTVPKRDLVDNLAVMLQNGQLEIDVRMPLAEALAKEILAFRSKISLNTGNETFEAWREKDHDDLVLAVALACWRSRTRHIGGPRSSNLGVAA